MPTAPEVTIRASEPHLDRSCGEKVCPIPLAPERQLPTVRVEKVTYGNTSGMCES